LSPTELPLVSMVVPTYQRARYLPHLFAAIGAQVYPAEKLELIVVDNSSTDDTESVVDAWARAMPFPVRFHRKSNNGPAASRNVGARLARGEVLGYTDSDCIPDPRWVVNAVHRLRAGADMVGGPMIGLRRASDGLVQQKQIFHDDGTYPTGNVFMWRRWFDAVGGFDERFGIYPWGGLVAGEDTDFAWRARRAGASVQWAYDVRVGHQIAPDPTAVQLMLGPVILQIFPRLIRSIPELRDTRLWHRYFVDEEHFRFDLALVGAVASVLAKRKEPLVLMLPWLEVLTPQLKASWRVGGLQASATCLARKVHSAIGEALVLSCASIRYRRVVL
jgi:glycosyltransferase involved in cell wall biosynthesis